MIVCDYCDGTGEREDRDEVTGEACLRPCEHCAGLWDDLETRAMRAAEQADEARKGAAA